MILRLLPLAGVFLAPLGSAGELAVRPAPDKFACHLFNPTPDGMLREMSTDRPDLTESPFTVDAGRVQLEMDFANFTRDRHNPERTDTRVESWAFATTNVRLGLWHNAELQIIIEPYNTSRTVDRATGVVTRASGFGDLTLRTKVNLWGNDGGTTACAVMPFLKLPTNQHGLGNRAVEGGVIVPFAVKLPRGWNMGLMTEVDFIEDSDARGHHAEWINTITFSREIAGKLGGYVEFASNVSAESGAPWIGIFGTGLTYAVTGNLQLDCGVNLGLTRSAPDINPFVGISWRF